MPAIIALIPLVGWNEKHEDYTCEISLDKGEGYVIKNCALSRINENQKKNLFALLPFLLFLAKSCFFAPKAQIPHSEIILRFNILQYNFLYR